MEIFPTVICLVQGNIRDIILIYMSTLAAARADNFYYSKNYNPDKVPPKKSELAEQKPFKVVQGQRVGGTKVRYQTPFHVRCEGCQNMVAKGVRFNSIKTWVDNFHSTKIYEFRMKCPQCPQKFVVRTDPENCDYIYVSGAKRIFQVGDCTDQSRIRDEAVQRKIDEDPFFKLETQFKDKEAYGAMEHVIEKIQDHQERGNNDFQLNRMLRKEIKKKKEQEEKYFDEKAEKNFQIPLLPANIQDQKIASSVKFKTKPIKKEEKAEKSQRDKLKQKMKNLHPNFKKILKKEILCKNKPTNHLQTKK